jgi:hypothetical protein
MLHSAEHVFWRALSARPGDPRIVLDAARLTRWAANEGTPRGAPSNFAAKAALVRALVPGARGRERFRRVADLAHRTGRPHVATLAERLAARRA